MRETWTDFLQRLWARILRTAYAFGILLAVDSMVADSDQGWRAFGAGFLIWVGSAGWRDNV